MRGEFQEINYNEFNYSTARGLFFDGNDVYALEVYDGGRTPELGIKLYGNEEEYTAIVDNHPRLHGAGIEESLSLSSQQARLPETDEEIEAYARYAMSPGDSFDYKGPRELDDLNY